MNRIILLISGVALVLVLGCRDRDEQRTGEEYGKTVEPGQPQIGQPPLGEPQVGQPQPGQPHMDQPPTDITAERQAYLSDLERRRATLDREIQQFEGTAGDRAQDIRQRLDQARQALNQAIERANRATAEEWAEARQNVADAMDRLQRAYDEAAAELRRDGTELPPRTE
jgi:uncharacterized protein YukE